MMAGWSFWTKEAAPKADVRGCSSVQTTFLVVALAGAVLLGACTPRNPLAAPSATPSGPTAMCFNAPPADWVAAMSKSVATLDGVNFAPSAVDGEAGIAYGYFQSASQQGIAAVDLRTGKLSVISVMTPSESGVTWMSFGDGWLAWAQGESRSVLGIWSIQVWNSQTHEKRQIATSRLADGSYLTGQLVFPVVGHGYVAWNQPVSTVSADVRVYRFAPRTTTTVDSGYVSSPVFAGSYLVWGKKSAAPDSPAEFRFADAATLEPMAGPAQLSRPYAATYLAGSSDYMLWIAAPRVVSPSNSMMWVDALGPGRVTEFGAANHVLQFPTIAGSYLIWFGGDKNSIVDLHTASGFDIPLPSGVAAAGDTIVVAKIANLSKVGAGTTTISVIHPSQLTRLGSCEG
jgi:hypothetical protein